MKKKKIISDDPFHYRITTVPSLDQEFFFEFKKNGSDSLECMWSHNQLNQVNLCHPFDLNLGKQVGCIGDCLDDKLKKNSKVLEYRPRIVLRIQNELFGFT